MLGLGGCTQLYGRSCGGGGEEVLSIDPVSHCPNLFLTQRHLDASAKLETARLQAHTHSCHFLMLLFCVRA